MQQTLVGGEGTWWSPTEQLRTDKRIEDDEQTNIAPYDDISPSTRSNSTYTESGVLCVKHLPTSWSNVSLQVKPPMYLPGVHNVLYGTAKGDQCNKFTRIAGIYILKRKSYRITLS